MLSKSRSDKPHKSFTYIYVTVLCIVAAITIINQYFIKSVLTEQMTDSQIINISGRQRMLSQKITKTAYQITCDFSGDNSHLYKELSVAVHLLAQSHNKLKTRETEELKGDNSEEIQQLFAELEADYVGFIKATNKFLALKGEKDQKKSKIVSMGVLTLMDDYGRSFLDKMDAITARYTDEAGMSITQLKYYEITLVAITFLVLLIEGFWVFKPASRALKRFYEQVEEKENELKKKQKVLESTKERLANILDSIPLGVMIWEKNGDNYFTNNESRRLFGLAVDKINMSELPDRFKLEVNKSMFDKQAEEETSFTDLWKTGQYKSVKSHDVVYHKHYGDPIPLELATQPVLLEDSEGQQTYYITVFQDISERISSRRVLEEAFLEVQKTYVKLEETNLALEQVNTELESKVMERTKEISTKNRRLTSSISYARRIQKAVLHKRNEIHNYIEDSFLFYQPRDLVSGDFYWYARVNDYLVLVAADCTGHGVPGAFMSLIGHNILNEVVNMRGVVYPEQILNELHVGVRNVLHQDELKNKSNDGMELAISVIHTKENTLMFAGARRPLVYMEKGADGKNELKVIKGDTRPIGGVKREHSKPFTRHTLNIQPNQPFYMYSDGYQDQFGGDDGTKFYSKRFKDLLLSVSHLPMEKQLDALKYNFKKWKDGYVQIDDVMVMGFRFDASKHS